ncbi:Crotonase superfamily [Canna indica]|uniref:Crotonase superfamily n=1 Tax=Canna indica TaxID=4628 RepID=A0AAQ3JTP1_9LILI|nr:Crotonase superfamily [Canna indica]
MGKGRTEMEVGADGVAVITIVNPPVNALSPDVIYSLIENYEQALGRKDVKAIVLTGAGGKFSGGADISTFKSGNSKESKPGFAAIDFLTDTLEDARKPSVAAIDSLALGGGLEIAMACHGRIATSTTQLGLPELQLGIIPGLGGTQRLPRLVGLAKSLDMMLTSKSIKGDEAHLFGLVDAIVSRDELVKTARSWALDISEFRRPWIKSLYNTYKLEPLAEAREILKLARAKVHKQAANVEHPHICINVIEDGIVSGPRAGLLKEVEWSQKLQSSETSKSLVHFFFAQRATSKVTGVTDLGLMPRTIRKVAIIGGGLMGSGIATVLILSNYPVILKEVNESYLQAGIGRVKANLQSRVNKGKMNLENCEKALSLLTGVLDYEHLKDVDLVIEAVIENVNLKQQIFSDLEKYCPRHCILASNTSTIDLNMIGENTVSQDRIVGAHFFSPAHVMPLLEIVYTSKTSPQVIVDLLSIGKKIHKTPIVVGNCTGFAVNRMFFPYSQSAHLLVDHGLDVYEIDNAITKFGMPMGPFRLADLVGFGVGTATGIQYHKSFPDRCYKSMLLPILLEEKRTGEASRKGFYVYDDKRRASPDTDLKMIVEKSRSISGIVQDHKLTKLSDKDIVEMVFFPVVNEACRVLDEGIASKASDLDVASIMGMGFPSYRGGIMFWADTLGSNYIYTRLVEWSNTYGDFFRPCSYLKERATRGTLLSSAMADLSFIVGVLGNVISILVFTSPIGTFRRIVKKKSTESFKGLPYITTLLSTSLWCFYGLLKPGGLLVVTVNGVGTVMQAIYVTLFLVYAPKDTRVKMTKLVGVVNVGFFGAVVLVTLLAVHGSVRLLAVGFLCAALTVGMYASPMAAMRTMVKTKSVEYMPFFLSFFLFLNGGVWSIYSVLVRDYFIGVPNAIGFVLGSAQLILYAVYRGKTPAKASELADEEEGSAHLVGKLDQMQGDEESNSRQKHLSKGSSLPKPPPVSRQLSFQKLVKSVSMTPYELHSIIDHAKN